MAKKKERSVNVSGKPKHSLDSNRDGGSKNKGGRTASTVRRLKMYNTQPKRNPKGKIIKHDLQSKELPSTRIQPDRRWFGNTRVVNQKELEFFREELQSRLSNNYNVILKEKMLPLSLLNDHQKHTTLYDSMEGSAIFDGNKEEVVEEEHVLIDLDDVFGQVHIPPNAPYVLSGLDTPNPILVIDENIKLIGEYEESIGTCLVFNETDETTVVHEETGPSEANLFQGRCIVENKQHPTKEIKPVTSLHKILRFRLFTETDSQDSSYKQMEDDSNL